MFEDLISRVVKKYFLHVFVSGSCKDHQHQHPHQQQKKNSIYNMLKGMMRRNSYKSVHLDPHIFNAMTIWQLKFQIHSQNAVSSQAQRRSNTH